MKIKNIIVIIICLLGILFTLPNFMSLSTNYNTGLWMPSKTIRLGLDLQGGISILLGIDSDKLIDSEVQNLEKQINKYFVQWGVEDRYKAQVKDHKIQILSQMISYDLNKEKKEINDNKIGNDAGIDDFSIDSIEIKLKRDLRALYGVGIEFEYQKNVLLVFFTTHRINSLLDQALTQNIEIVRRRVDETGINEPSIQKYGRDRILVQLPGVNDPQRIKNLLGQTAQLNFHYVYTEDSESIPYGYQLLPDINNPDKKYTVSKYIEVPGKYLSSANATYDNGIPVVSLSFNDVGARRFANTTRDIGSILAIVLDNQVISAPRVTKMILDGQAIIKGDMSIEQARDLAVLLRSGALPAPMEILEEKIIGPDLGEDAVRTGTVSGSLAMVVVMIMMIVIYGAFGVFAFISLALNMCLVLGALSFLQATLTLPGMAGIVLTIGMAVDANVIIFERLREERFNQPGLPMLKAINLGFQKSFQSIFDANLTTILAGFILFWLGSGAVKGFAVTLILGVVSSMFTSIIVNKMLLTTFYRLLKYHRN